MATTRRTWRCSWRRRRGRTRGTWPTLIAKRLQETEGIADVEVAGPGFLNITVEAGAQGQVAQDIVAAGAAYGSPTLLNGPADQPRVRVGQPDRAAAPRRYALGGGRGRAGADLHGVGGRGHREYYFNDHGAQIDRFARSLLATARGGGGAGGRVRRPVHRRHRRRGDGAAARRSWAAGRGGAGGLPRRRRADDVRRDQARPARLRGRLRRLLPRGRPARLGRGRAGGRAAHARWATPTRRTARSGCAPSSTATTRTGSSSSPTASRRTSPATSPTTSTRRSVGSGAASSCSARTTTGTSAG